MNRKESAQLRRQKKRKQQALVVVLITVLLAVIGTVVLFPKGEKDALSPLPEPAVTETPALRAAASSPTVKPALSPTPSPTPSQNPTPSSTPSVITISAVGDCTLADDVKSGKIRFRSAAQKNGYGYFFENVREIFERDDLTIVNLEGPLTNQKTMRSGRTFNFRGKPEYAQILSLGGVECANVANNHAKDFEIGGLNDTLKALEAEGIVCFGFNRTEVVSVKGIRVGLIGLTQWDYSIKQIKRRISALRKDCDLLIVNMHWGEELRYRATGRQKKYAHACVDAGADLVLGHHPHVLGGIESYKDRLILYSLGNFCFGGNKNPSDKRTMIFQQQFSLDGEGLHLGKITLVPASISSKSGTNNYQPTPVTDNAAEEVLSLVRKLSSAFSAHPDI